MTSQSLRNHFRVAKEVCQHTHSTCSVVGVDATKHVQLPISSEPTGSTMDQSCCAYNCTARVVDPGGQEYRFIAKLNAGCG